MVLFSGGEGAEVIYALRNKDTLAASILNSLSKAGEPIRKYYQRRLPTDSSKDYYYVIRETPNTESLIVEYGFLDNVTDAERLKNNYEQYAEAVVQAVTNYAGYNYVPLTGSGYYVVQKGDTLWSIAKKFGLTVDKLKEINNLASNTLSIGETLLVKAETTPEDNLVGYEYYTVIKGDTLYGIANKYNLTVDELKKLNNLSTNTLTIGQKLIVGETQSSNTYIVKKGDSLYSIANLYNVTVDALKAANNLTSNLLSIGQELIIPSSPEKENINTITYTVVKGDTLYSIAKKYNITVSELTTLNNLTDNVLSIGQKLVIPR